ncbi:hypothetical protein C0Q70_07830 [Pomacea canaliculata]|uniref:Uncharacterized protein n=1 Tax=Pomacea canaliculata TaxID=400727 RepID=A0A2T7PG53_POMCA|nr:hypothetical protein C0Q70_07830 [Pomacea canaliculata]
MPLPVFSRRFFVVLGCLTLGVLSSISDFESLLSAYTVYMEIVILVWVTLEFIVRLWSAGCRSRYQGLAGRFKFLQRPLCIIDMVLIMAGVTTLVVGSTQEHFATSVISGLRFFQILRMVRMDRRGGTWKLLGSVVWAHSQQELITTVYIGMLALVFSSYFVYLAEKDAPGPTREGEKAGSPPKFSNFADSIWWGVVTLCTVGYGDVVPTTWGGKVIASFSAVLGISFFALPAGILGSGFALKVQQQQRQKHLNRRRVPAAELIQCLWRCYAADEHSVSVATWKPHLVPCPSPTADRPWKNNTSFVSRFSTRRRDRSSTNNNSKTDSNAQSPMSVRHSARRSAISTSEEEVPNVLDRYFYQPSVRRGGGGCRTVMAVRKSWLLDCFYSTRHVVQTQHFFPEEPELSPRITQLTEQDKRAIRALRKIRYFVARRKFREALRPYDVKDVIEQYSAGHIDMLARIKNLQGRLDQILGRQGSKSKDVYDSKISLASRVVKVERQVEDIESKVDLLIDMYKEDRKILLQHLQLQYGTQSPGPPPSQVKPRPILVDKQFTSEPATPTGVGQNPNRPMHRNLSDLSQRIKKRVTYRCLSLHDPPKKNPPTNLKSSGSVSAHGSSPLAAAVRSNEGGGRGDGEGHELEGVALNPSHPSSSHTLLPPSPRAAHPLFSSADCGGSSGGQSEEALIDFTSAPDEYQSDTYRFDDPHLLYPSPHASPVLPPVSAHQVFAHAQAPLPVVTSHLTYSVLSTLSEQKSIESDTNIPFLDGPLSEDSRGSRAPDDVTGNGGGDDCDDDESGGAVGKSKTHSVLCIQGNAGGPAGGCLEPCRGQTNINRPGGIRALVISLLTRVKSSPLGS